MSTDRDRWNEKHAAASAPGDPLPFVVECVRHLGRQGTALDVACGTGRHALFLAEQGFEVLAVDVSDTAVERLSSTARRRGLTVATERRDVIADGLPDGEFDLVVVTRFLARPLHAAIEAAVAPGGALVFETFTTRKSEATDGRFPREYCLERSELASAFPTLRTVLLREEPDEDVASYLGQRSPGDDGGLTPS